MNACSELAQHESASCRTECSPAALFLCMVTQPRHWQARKLDHLGKESKGSSSYEESLSKSDTRHSQYWTSGYVISQDTEFSNSVIQNLWGKARTCQDLLKFRGEEAFLRVPVCVHIHEPAPHPPHPTTHTCSRSVTIRVTPLSTWLDPLQDQWFCRGNLSSKCWVWTTSKIV